MIGLEEVVSDYIQGLRDTEIELSLKSRVWLVTLFVIGNEPMYLIY